MTATNLFQAPAESQVPEAQTPPRPFLKWAGGKAMLVPVLRKCVPPSASGCYFEPFLGGGAFFFDLGPSSAVLGDLNQELVNCYAVVRDSPRELYEQLSRMPISEHEFYRVREAVRQAKPQDRSGIEHAAQFIYLNKTCFNGLYRVNRAGQFNTPFGKYRQARLADPVNLVAASRALKNAELVPDDYRVTTAKAKKGDFVYLDPPYVPLGGYSDFRRYTKEGSAGVDHEELAETFSILDSRGCFVLLSNSGTDGVRKLYSQYNLYEVQVPRFVNCKGDRRARVTEFLIANYELGLPK